MPIDLEREDGVVLDLVDFGEVQDFFLGEVGKFGSDGGLDRGIGLDAEGVGLLSLGDLAELFLEVGDAVIGVEVELVLVRFEVDLDGGVVLIGSAFAEEVEEGFVEH